MKIRESVRKVYNFKNLAYYLINSISWAAKLKKLVGKSYTFIFENI